MKSFLTIGHTNQNRLILIAEGESNIPIPPYNREKDWEKRNILMLYDLTSEVFHSEYSAVFTYNLSNP